MKISELKEPLKSLAIKRREERDSDYMDFSDDLDEAFSWSKTLEDWEFWNSVNQCIDVFHYDCYPKEKEETKLFVVRPVFGMTIKYIIEAIDKDQAIEFLYDHLGSTKIKFKASEIVKTGNPRIIF
jgi:hypothetical protein